MIEAFRKIWHFAGDETKHVNQSVVVEFLNALLQMFRVAAIYFVVLALTDGTQSSKPAWLALAAVLLVLSNWVKLTKKWHPIVFIGLSAAVGVVFRFGGV